MMEVELRRSLKAKLKSGQNKEAMYIMLSRYLLPQELNCTESRHFAELLKP